MLITKIELVYLYLYTVEMVLKMLGLGIILNRGSYFRDPWNILDFVIVATGHFANVSQSNNSINLNGLRSLRVLRSLKQMTKLRRLKALIVTIFAAVPPLMEIIAVLMFIYLILSIIGLQLLIGQFQNNCYDLPTGRLYIDSVNNQGPFLCSSGHCPLPYEQYATINNPPGYSGVPYTNLTCGKWTINPDGGTSNFDNIFQSFYMNYVVTSLEGWTALMTYAMRTFSYFAFLYFFLNVFLCAFFLKNLTMAVVTIKFGENQEIEEKAEEELIKHSKFTLTF